MMMVEEAKEKKPHLIFAYGTLKRGFPNYNLTEDLIAKDDAVLVGSYSTKHPLPLVLGPNGIPYLINLPGSGHRVKGELYAISDDALAFLDEFEGLSVGHYERLPIEVVGEGGGVGVGGRVEAYFAHREFGEGLWKKKGEVGMKDYGLEEAKEYVRQADREPGTTALSHLRHLVFSP